MLSRKSLASISLYGLLFSHVFAIEQQERLAGLFLFSHFFSAPAPARESFVMYVINYVIIKKVPDPFSIHSFNEG